MARTIFAPKSPEYEAFFDAVSAGELEKVKVALTPSMDVNALVSDGWEGRTALHIASAAGNLVMMEFLIASGASPDAPDRSPHGASTPLHDAAFHGRSRGVEILLDHGANINAIGEQGGTALHQVLRNKAHVESKHIDTIKVLLDWGHDINSVALDLGDTVLHQAAELGSVELVQFLLDKGANINPDIQSFSVISTAASHGKYGVVNFLLERGVKVDKDALARASSVSMFNLLISYADNTTISGSGALHAACKEGSARIDLVTLMLDKDFDIEAINDYGDTPLLSACGSSCVSSEIVELLLSKGAAVTARSGKPYTANIVKGDTPLHRAAWRSDPKAVELLLKAGADLTSRNDEGQTPLIKFASTMNGNSSTSFHQDRKPRLEVFKMLIDAGADVNAVDGKHRSALHALALCGDGNRCKARQQSEAVDLLVRGGIAIEAIDSDGRSALDIFSAQDDHEMVDLLSRYLPGHESTSSIKIDGAF